MTEMFFRRHFSGLIILQKNQFYKQHFALKNEAEKLSLCDLGPQMRMTAIGIIFSSGVYSTGDTILMTEYQFRPPAG